MEHIQWNRFKNRSMDIEQEIDEIMSEWVDATVCV